MSELDPHDWAAIEAAIGSEDPSPIKDAVMAEMQAFMGWITEELGDDLFIDPPAQVELQKPDTALKEIAWQIGAAALAEELGKPFAIKWSG